MRIVILIFILLGVTTVVGGSVWLASIDWDDSDSWFSSSDSDEPEQLQAKIVWKTTCSTTREVDELYCKFKITSQRKLPIWSRYNQQTCGFQKTRNQDLFGVRHYENGEISRKILHHKLKATKATTIKVVFTAPKATKKSPVILYIAWMRNGVSCSVAGAQI